jgi:hypothetical protein
LSTRESAIAWLIEHDLHGTERPPITKKEIAKIISELPSSAPS